MSKQASTSLPTSRNGILSSPDQLTRLPPHDIPAEEAVLAACMVDDHVPGKVFGLVQPHDFFREKNQWVYEAICTLFVAGRPVNQITVAHELARTERLELINGSGYLAQLVAELPTVIGVEYYASLVARTGAQRRLISVAGQLAQEAYDNAITPQEVVAQTQRRLIEVTSGAFTEDWEVYGATQARDEPWLVKFLTADTRRQRGISTGLRALDRALVGGGYLPGKLILIGAQTSVGKSTFLRCNLRNMALSGHEVALITVEQNRQEVMREILFSTAGVDYYRMERENRDATLAERKRLADAMQLLSGLPLHISDVPGLTPSRIEARILALRSEHPNLEVVGIDYAQLVRPDRNYRRDDEAALAVIQELRDMAARTGLAIALTTQLTREGTERGNRSSESVDYRPKLRHFRGGGGMEFIPAAIIALYREDWVYERGYKDPPMERLELTPQGPHYIPTGRLECIVLKQQLGPPDLAVLHFDGSTRAIADLE